MLAVQPRATEEAMADYTAKRIGDMETIVGGVMKRVRAELGVTSFGMQIEDLPPHWDGYPNHAHDEDGQEEVYVVLRGSGEMAIDGDVVTLDPETVVRVGPGTKRKITPGPDGMRVLAVRAAPHPPFQPLPFTHP